jgi:beta-phosphoglucomutase-like phosphatase (HAD superfamily)
MIKAVIFDMDGVIVDSEPIESLAWEKVLAEYNKKPIFNDNGLIHVVGRNSLEEVMGKHGLNEDPEVVRSRKRVIFGELVVKDLIPISGFTKLFKALKKEKFKLALASNRFEEHVLLIADKLRIRKSFKAIVGNSPEIKTKPAPDIFLKAAEKLGINPGYCLVIEDSEHGITAAKTAGMKVIAVPNKYTMYQDFSKADKIVDSLLRISVQMLENL